MEAVDTATPPKMESGSCTVSKEKTEFEGVSAITLLERIHDKNPLLRCLAIALANAPEP